MSCQTCCSACLCGLCVITQAWQYTCCNAHIRSQHQSYFGLHPAQLFPHTLIASCCAVVHKEMEDAHDAHAATMADKMARFAALKEQYSALEARVPEELARLAAAMLAAVEEGEDAVAAKLRELDGKLAKGKKGATKGRGDVLALLQQLAAAM